MERLNNMKGLRRGMLMGMLAALLLAAGGCSAKDGTVDKQPPAKGGGCSFSLGGLLG